jgi:hypothetical protein
MPRVGFEPIIPVFKRTKTAHSLDRAATIYLSMHLSIYPSTLDSRLGYVFIDRNLESIVIGTCPLNSVVSNH